MLNLHDARQRFHLLLAAPAVFQIGNGYVGVLLSGAMTENVAGVFNGHLSYALHTTSHRAPLPSAISTIDIAQVFEDPDALLSASALDLAHGAYLTAMPIRNGTAYCQRRTYAHRELIHLVVTEIVCNNSAGTEPFTVVMAPSAIETLASPDFSFELLPAPLGMVRLRCLARTRTCLQSLLKAKTKKKKEKSEKK